MVRISNCVKCLILYNQKLNIVFSITAEIGYLKKANDSYAAELRESLEKSQLQAQTFQEEAVQLRKTITIMQTHTKEEWGAEVATLREELLVLNNNMRSVSNFLFVL